MTAVSFLPSFVNDLREQGDANFARRVFTKLFDSAGNFRDDPNDHRYHGIDDAWIRYVSRGHTAFRIIYLRLGAEVHIYRAGTHAIEDNLVAPGEITAVVKVAGPQVAAGPTAGARKASPPNSPEPGRVMCSLRTPTLEQAILGRSLLPHREVTFVSPFISLPLLQRTAKIGRMLDRQIEDGAKVTLVTRPPAPDEIDAFADLDARGIELLFLPSLHAKLYYFVAAPERARPYGATPKDLIVLGSANLTVSGLAGVRDAGNEELSYRLPGAERDDIESFLAHIALQSSDLIDVRRDRVRNRKRL